MTDHKNLLDEARAAAGALEEYEFDGTAASNAAGALNALADAFEVLLGRAEKAEQFWHDSESECRAVQDRLDSAQRKIDALITEVAFLRGVEPEEVRKNALEANTDRTISDSETGEQR